MTRADKYILFTNCILLLLSIVACLLFSGCVKQEQQRQIYKGDEVIIKLPKNDFRYKEFNGLKCKIADESFTSYLINCGYPTHSLEWVFADEFKKINN